MHDREGKRKEGTEGETNFILEGSTIFIFNVVKEVKREIHFILVL